ncbi:MAG: metallophosphoesterase family protein [Flavobacteriaceae bacterium]|nr:metallophosphoesterase family protein [Flavobacteriaceae bacterium]
MQSILDQALQNAKKVTINCDSKLIFFSDLHRGDNSYADDFVRNMQIYADALQHYYAAGFTYFELGDGVELWENDSFETIYNAHQESFELLRKFHLEQRAYMIWGNHDMVFRDPKVVEKMVQQYIRTPDELQEKQKLFNLHYYESILLEIENTEKTILLIHGHQADWFNYKFWKVSRFFVRYLWMPLQKWFNVKDPTSPAKNYKNLIRVERNIQDWMLSNSNQMVIAGHTHRPRFPEPGDLPYFNDGSCVHPKSIIGIEIKDLEISLVKWHNGLDEKKQNKIIKTVLEGPKSLDLYL